MAESSTRTDSSTELKLKDMANYQEHSVVSCEIIQNLRER